MSSTDRPHFGIVLRILSGVLATGMFVCVKAVGDAVPLGEIVFFRSFFALIPLVIFLWARGEFPHGLATKRPLDHVIRSVFGAISLFGYFGAIVRLNVAEAALIAQLSPMMMAAVAVLLLSERLTVYRVGGLMLGFAGVIALVAPELGADTGDNTRLIGYAIGLGAALLSAIALTMVRSLSSTESPAAIAIYFVLASIIGSLFTVSSGWVVPQGYTLALLIAAGLFGGLTHVAMTLAFRYAEASRLAPFEYISLLWPVLADLFIFSTNLSSAFALAALLIIGGAFFASAERRR